MIIVNLKFKGIDHWNKPVFKDVDRKDYYGSVNTLFNEDDSEDKVLAYFKDNIDELEYFGDYFGCEPMGGLDENIKLNIL